MTPRASFVIPVYNGEKWLSKAIWSAREQTVKQIEIIVVNDGSTDGTADIINWHANEDKRVLHLCLDQNKGRSYARNAGNDAARGPIILVLDADDLAAKNRVKDTLDAFKAKKTDLLYGSFFVVDSYGNVERKILASAFNPEEAKTKKHNFICHSTMAYTRELARAIRYDEGDYSTLGLDDWKFQWDAYKAGYAIRHVRTPLSYYRVLKGSISGTRDPKDVEKAKEAFLATL